MKSAIVRTIEMARQQKKGVIIFLSPDADPIDGVEKINVKLENYLLHESVTTLRHGGDDVPTIVVSTNHHPNLARLEDSTELFRVSGTVHGDSGGRPASALFAFMVIDTAVNCPVDDKSYKDW